MANENPAPGTAPATPAPSKEAPAADPKATPVPAPAADSKAAPAPAAEPKADAPKPGAETKEKPAEKPVALVKDDLKLPDGSLLDPKTVDEIIAFSNEKGISKETAQVILERESKILSSHVEAEKAKVSQAQNSWTEISRTDKEIGGDKFAENVECSHRVFKNFGSEGLMKFLDETKLGNHPEVIRTFNRIGRALGIMDDKFVISDGSASGEKKDAASVLYGKTSQPKGE